MAIVIPKKKLIAAEPVEAPVELLSEFAAEIDNYGRLAAEAAPILAEIKALNAKLKPFKDAEKALQAKLDEMEADDDLDGMVELGAKFRAEIGKKGTSRSIKDMARVLKLMGRELFLKVCDVKLKEIDAYLTQPQRDEVLESARTSRSFKVLPRA